MFGSLFRVVVKPGHRQAFTAFFEKDIQVARNCEPGTVRFDVYKDPRAENAFFVYEAYLNRKAFNKHKANKPYQRWVAEIRPKMVVDFQRLFETSARCWLRR